MDKFYIGLNQEWINLDFLNVELAVIKLQRLHLNGRGR